MSRRCGGPSASAGRVEPPLGRKVVSREQPSSGSVGPPRVDVPGEQGWTRVPRGVLRGCPVCRRPSGGSHARRDLWAIREDPASSGPHPPPRRRPPPARPLRRAPCGREKSDTGVTEVWSRGYGCCRGNADVCVERRTQRPPVHQHGPSPPCRLRRRGEPLRRSRRLLHATSSPSPRIPPRDFRRAPGTVFPSFETTPASSWRVRVDVGLGGKGREGARACGVPQGTLTSSSLHVLLGAPWQLRTSGRTNGVS